MSESFQNFKKCSVAILCSFSLAACSVGMALDGQKDPDLSVVKQNVHRTDIETQLGLPTKEERLPNGCVKAIYQCEIGKEPSAGRAVAHGVMDVMTLGIWEIVGTPVERLKGEKVTMIITYDRQGRVISGMRVNS